MDEPIENDNSVLVNKQEPSTRKAENDNLNKNSDQLQEINKETKKFKSKLNPSKEFNTQEEANEYDKELEKKEKEKKEKEVVVAPDNDSIKREENFEKDFKNAIDKEGHLVKPVAITRFPTNLPPTKDNVAVVSFGSKPIFYFNCKTGECVAHPNATPAEIKQLQDTLKGSTMNGNEIKYLGQLKDAKGLEKSNDGRLELLQSKIKEVTKTQGKSQDIKETSGIATLSNVSSSKTVDSKYIPNKSNTQQTRRGM